MTEYQAFLTDRYFKLRGAGLKHVNAMREAKLYVLKATRGFAPKVRFDLKV